MKRIATALLLTLLMLPALSAQTDYYSYDYSYDAKACREALSSKSACNKGKEPFTEFLKKFNTSDIFRRSRFRTDQDEENPSLSYMKFLCNPNPDSDYIFQLKCVNTNTKRLREVGTFKNVTANRIVYTYCDADDTGGSSMRFVFKRIDGLWYLVSAVLAG